MTVGVALVNLLVAHLLGPTIGNERPWGGPPDLLIGAVVAISVALYLYARHTTADPIRVIH